MITRAVFPGSFDPVHYGHINIARRAASIFDELIIAVYEHPQKDVLFSAEERLALLKRATSDIKNAKVVSYSGLTIKYVKEIDAKVMVRGLRVFSDFDYEFRMALANQEMDMSIETVSLITNHRYTFISSSTVKEIVALGGDVSTMVPPYVEEAMKKKLLAYQSPDE